MFWLMYAVTVACCYCCCVRLLHIGFACCCQGDCMNWCMWWVEALSIRQRCPTCVEPGGHQAHGVVDVGVVLHILRTRTLQLPQSFYGCFGGKDIHNTSAKNAEFNQSHEARANYPTWIKKCNTPTKALFISNVVQSPPKKQSWHWQRLKSCTNMQLHVNLAASPCAMHILAYTHVQRLP